ncbi:DCA10-like protein [Mya arenaria]|uniref:DCA10-like protein n=1 Tax=Mya arenaria TaxID=6604 RepID=A0ABY7FK28_MYAAR|nr:DCA10-like protein [Mya arenaria]WAR22597.1 DCA10-like protein [Mya arenaria]
MMHRSRQSSFITRQNREYGYSSRVGDTAKICASLTSAIKAHRTWDPRKTVSDTDHGGVFNFGFSKNGSLLGVAMERKSVLLFDALNGKLVAKKTNAHTDCVNCVKFLDDRLFATCSDDTTVALWDARYLKHNVQTFRGHSNWVKNIEYDSSQGVLLTSGFDGCIYTWNINRYSTEDTSNRVFYTSGLMRSKLSPDFSKLIISTHEGYIIIIHDLDLSTLGEDLKGFKPNMYRLMQRSQTPLKIGLQYNHVFEQDRNRWTCVHDLQDYGEVKKTPSRPWEVAWTAPHTSSAYCTSTNTPAYSSQAPSARARGGNQSAGSVTENTSSAAGDGNQSNEENVNQSDDPGTENQSAAGNNDQSNEENLNHSADFVTENQSATACSNPSHEEDRNQAKPGNSNQPMEENMNQPGVDESSSVSAGNQSMSTGSNEENEGSSSASANQERNLQSLSQATNADNLANDGSQNNLQSDQNDSSSVPVRDSLLPREDIESDSSEGETSSTQPLRISRGVGNGSVNPSLRPVPPASSPLIAGPMHNSLIQIRRGSRQDDGSFSFSISVHTSSGRTIMFSQEDIEADDEEDRDFRITPVNTESRRQNESNGTDNRSRVQDRSSENTAQSGSSSRGINQSDQVSGLNLGINGNRSSSLSIEINDMDSVDVDNNDNSDVENESEHDIIDDVMMFPDTDSSDGEENDPVQGSVNINWPSHAGLNSGVNISIQSNDDSNDEPMFRHTGPSRIRRRAINTVRQNASPWSRASSNQTDNSSSSNSNSQNVGNRRVNTAANSNNPAPGGSVDVQPRSNSFMFVLESNSGTRRRRVLNLSYLDTLTETENSQLKKNIHTNTNRLQGYMEECNVGRGFIKEVAFSSDGRLISSPFGFGIRLFSFDPQCNELCDCYPRSPVKLYEATCSLAHVNIVVATQFSPVHNLVVSGCLDGKIAFHQPVL